VAAKQTQRRSGSVVVSRADPAGCCELSEARRLGFILLPGFSMLTLSAAWESFRLVNQLGQQVYSCETVSVLERVVASSNGITVVTDLRLKDQPTFDLTFIVASRECAEFRNASLEKWLRTLAAKGRLLAPLGVATILLARIGLLDGYQCVTHWSYHDQFQSRFPSVLLNRGLYCIDRTRLTAAGGLSAMDLGLSIISRSLGGESAKQVAEEALHARLRVASEAQRMDAKFRYEVTDVRVIRALEMMEGNLERPLTLSQVASGSAVSERQLERLFAKHMAKRPLQVYTEIRLRYAQELVRTSTESISEIAARFGFSDGSHLSRQYRAAFGESPTQTRESLSG
jgi:transcriptional regulator GlxA family with amidase domain